MLIIKKGLPYFSKDKLEKPESKDILLNIPISTCTPLLPMLQNSFPLRHFHSMSDLNR